jgi:hypothetical protein
MAYPTVLTPREKYAEARDRFLSLASHITIPKLQKSTYYPEGHEKAGRVKIGRRGGIIGIGGRSLNFGSGHSRRYGYTEHKFNSVFPELFKAAVDIGNAVVPLDWNYTTITLNHNVKANKHTDGKNVGDSVIIAFGDFSFGGLYVYTSDNSSRMLYDIKDTPIMFNGALLPHETEEFLGNRYSLIFYKQKHSPEIPGTPMRGLI